MSYLKKRLHELSMPSNLNSKILCHGQYFCIYPAAYDTDDERQAEIDPIMHRMGNIETDILTSDGVTLKCYLMKQTLLPSGARGTIIMFHGNGYHSWSYLTCGNKFRKMGFNALMVEYRGYGASRGKPSERGLRRDAQAALDFVLSRDDLKDIPIIVHGHSMGGAVAIDLASRNPDKLQAVILENTFLSIPSVAKNIPVIRHLTFLIHQTWNSASKITKIPRSTPILFLSGTLDDVVPEEHTRGLKDIAASRDPESKADLSDLWRSFPNGTHADTWIQPGYFETVGAFLRDVHS